MTIIINLESGEIIHAVEGKSMENITPLLPRLKGEAVQLKAMAIDMNAAYASAVHNHLPGIDVVFNRFHVVALLNTAIEEVRRDQLAKCNELGLKVIKGMRFLLLRNYEQMDFKRKSSLECLLEVNRPISLAHAMKEQIRQFWSKQTVKEGAGFLAWWIMDAVETGVRELEKAGKTLLRHWQGLINYFKHLSPMQRRKGSITRSTR